MDLSDGVSKILYGEFCILSDENYIILNTNLQSVSLTICKHFVTSNYKCYCETVNILD